MTQFWSIDGIEYAVEIAREGEWGAEGRVLSGPWAGRYVWCDKRTGEVVVDETPRRLEQETTMRTLPIIPDTDLAGFGLTDEAIERKVERLMDRADAAFMADNSGISQEEYNAWTKQLSRWADSLYAQIA